MSDPENTGAGRLDALAGLVQGVDAQNPTPEQEQAQQQEQAQVEASEQGAREWGMVMFTIGGMLQMVAPELKNVYTEDRCFAWGQSANAVAQKYGWNSPGNSPEWALAASTVGFAVPTFMVIRGRIKQTEALDGTLLGKVVGWWRKRRGVKVPPAKQPTGVMAGGEGGSDGGNP